MCIGGARDRDWRDDLDRLFRPSSVAIVGASERNSYCRKLLDRVVGREQPRLSLVTRNGDPLRGQPTYRSLEEVPEPPETVIIAVNRERVLGAVRQAESLGVHDMIVISGGFAGYDGEGARLQRELEEFALSRQVRICGPNCTGTLDIAAGTSLYSGSGVVPDLSGSVGVVFQSGGLLNPFMAAMSYRSFGISKVATAGNQASVRVEDYVSYYARDPGVRVIAVYAESFADTGRTKRAFAQAREAGKQVVVLKAGRSARGREATLSHTGSALAGRSTLWHEYLEQAGVIVVETLDELVDSCGLAGHVGQVAGRRAVSISEGLALITVSGGDASLMSDLAEREGLRLPELGGHTRDVLVELTRKTGLVANPFDMGNPYFRASDPEFERCFEAICADETVSCVATRLDIGWQQPRDEDQELYRRLKAIADSHGVMLVIPTRASENWDPLVLRRLHGLGIPVFMEHGRFFRAAARVSRALEAALPAVSPTEEQAALPSAAAAGLAALPPEAVLGNELTEDLLAAVAIPVPASLVAADPEELAAASKTVSYPQVLKRLSTDQLHRRANGGVVVNVLSAEQAYEAYRWLTAERGDPVLVQAMVRGDLEMFVGSMLDAELGTVVTFGLGGALVEHRQRMPVLFAPFDRAAALRALRAWDGWQPVSSEVLSTAIADVIVGVGRIAAAVHQLAPDASVDLNPLIIDVGAQTVTVVDAKVSRPGAAGAQAVSEAAQ